MVESRITEEISKEFEANEDASSRLRDDAIGMTSRAGSDRVSEKGSGSGDKKVDNPYDHVGYAGVAIKEIDALKSKKDDEKITLTDSQGQMREVTVKERRAELEQFVEKELKQGISAADRIDRDRVESSLFEVRTKQSNAPNLKAFEALGRQEEILEAMKHAAAATRFAYATHLAERGDTVQSKVYLDQIAKVDKEAQLDPVYKELARRVEATVSGQPLDRAAATTANSAVGDDPFALLNSAGEKRQKGDAAGADADYKKAIEAAQKLDPQLLKDKLTEIEQAKKDNAGNAEVLEQIKGIELALRHPTAIAQVNYAEFLMQQKRSAEATALLDKVSKDDPQFVKENPEFQQLQRSANVQKKGEEPFENPFPHLSTFKEKYEAGDLEGARKELEAAVTAAGKIDRKLMQDNKKVCDDTLKELKAKPEGQRTQEENAQIKELEERRAVYDALDHAESTCKLALGRFELAGKNYNSAHALFEQVKNEDPEVANKPETKMDELLEAAKEPSTWGKVWGWTKDILKDLVCDAAAILAGVGAAVLTGWSGPAAVGIGAVAGAATYTAMKTLVFGEKLSWTMPIWGAIDGASGGLAAIARTGLTKVGGKIIAQEVADSALIKTGVGTAAIEGMEGMKAGETALKLSKEALGQMAKSELSFGQRLVNKALPFTVYGSAEYRAAASATNTLGRRMFAANLLRDAGTAGTVSMVYRGTHGLDDLRTGKTQDFGTFAKQYAFGVASDSVAGGFLGPLGRALKVGTVPGIDTAITASGPRWYEAYTTHEYLTKTVEPTYKYQQVPLDLQKNKREFTQRYNLIQELQKYQGPEPVQVRDGLQPKIEGGKAVTPDENFDAEAALKEKK